MTHKTQTIDWFLTPGQPPSADSQIHWDSQTGRITAIEAVSAKKELPGTTFLTPGLVNAHTHIELYQDRPIPKAPDETMGDWLLAVLDVTRAMDEAQKRLNCERSLAEMVRTGTTCVNDISSTGVALAVLEDMGLRGRVSLEFFHPDPHTPYDITALYARWEALRRQYGTHPRLTMGLSPHSPYNVAPHAWKTAIATINPPWIHTHLAETQEERDWFATGQSPLDAVHTHVLGQACGPAAVGGGPMAGILPWLNDGVTVAHGVYLTPAEFAVLAQRHVGLAHCPRSNLALSGRTIENLPRLQQQGLTVGLGTDSRLSCPDLDLRAEGRVAMACHGMSPQAVFELMTLGSAKAMGVEATVGQLVPGSYADMVLWHHPAEIIDDPYTSWLSTETSVLGVWVGGHCIWAAAKSTIN